jgi:hypothetical protein
MTGCDMRRNCYRDTDRHDGDEAGPTMRSDVHRSAKYFGAPPVHHADQHGLRDDHDRHHAQCSRHLHLVLALGGLVEQVVDVTARRLFALLVSRPPHRGEQPQFGLDGLAVTHSMKA